MLPAIYFPAHCRSVADCLLPLLFTLIHHHHVRSGPAKQHVHLVQAEGMGGAGMGTSALGTS